MFTSLSTHSFQSTHNSHSFRFQDILTYRITMLLILHPNEPLSPRKSTDDTPLLAYDYKNHFRSLVLQLWNLAWRNKTSNKLLSIKSIPSPWTSYMRNSRQDEVILTRLRIGHTQLTHSYLLNPSIPSHPSCPHCHSDNMTL